MNCECPTQKEVLDAQHQFFIPAATCVAVLATIHGLPKGVPGPVRLAYTLTYFAATFVLLYQLAVPLPRYLERVFAWRFEDATDPIIRSWKSLLFSIRQLVRIPCLLLGAFLGSVALMTLALWFPDLQSLAWLYNAVWWLSLIGILLFPFAGGFLFHEVSQKYRALVHESQLSRTCEPRALTSLYGPAHQYDPQALQILPNLKFRAGGFDWDWNDFVQNGVVFGQIGSGKTSCVLNSILDGLLGSAAAAGMQPSGLILDPKGTFYQDVRNLCHRYQRASDLQVIDPDSPDPWRWNPFDSEDDEYELAMRFGAVCRSLGAKDTNTSFWQTKSIMFVQYALELLRLTQPVDEPPNFTQIHELASSFTAIAARTDQLDVTDPRCDGCLKFFATEWATMAPETRTSVQAHLTGMLFPFLKEPFATRFSGKSTIRIADLIDQGQLLYLHMPTAHRETMARTIGIFLKLEFYREVLKRPRKRRPSFFFCDEFQKFHTSASKEDKEQEKSDADTFRLSRESFHANIIATQNIGALGDLEIARGFLGNCLTAIFLRNPDEATNAFASQLFGQELMGIISASHGAGSGKLRPMGGQQMTAGDQSQARCPPDRFRELAVASRDQPIPHAESLVFLGGRGERPIPIRKLKWKRHPLS